MHYEEKNKYISAGATAFCLAVLVVFLLLCGFTHLTPPPPPEEEMIVEVQEIELAEDIVLDNDPGGGNGEEGGNFNPENPKPSPGKPDKPKPAPPVSNPTTANPDSKAVIPEETPTPGFDMGLVGKSGGTTSGTGSGDKTGKGLGLDHGPGTNNGNGGGHGGGWVKKPNFKKLSADSDLYFELDCTVDEEGKVISVGKCKDTGAPSALVEQARRLIYAEAKYSPGHPGVYKMGIKL